MSNQSENVCEIYINSSENNKYELTNKVIARLFKEFREVADSSDKISVTNKKEILTSFEKVIKCIRREVLGIKNLYEKQEDNIEILVELSETLDIKAEFDNLFKVYKNICPRDIEFKVEVNGDTDKLKKERERNIPDDIKIQIKEEPKEKPNGTLNELFIEALNEVLSEAPTEEPSKVFNKVVFKAANKAANKKLIKEVIEAFSEDI
jgi:hypothetical protein